MPVDRRLATQNNIVSEFAASGNSGLPDDHAMPANHNVVADHHQIINFCTLTHHCITV